MRLRSLTTRPPRHLRHRLLAVLTVGLVAVVLSGGCAGRGRGPGAQPDPGTPTAGPTGPAASPTAGPSPTPAPGGTSTPGSTARAGTWRLLPRAPADLGLWVSAWTGRELLVYGFDRAAIGDDLRSAGAAYNPTSNRWRTMPASPYPLQNIEGGLHAVWTGTELMFFGQMHAAYNPTTNRWRPLRVGGLAAPAVVVWTGRQVILWGGGCCGDVHSNGASYTPATDTWQSIPAAPIAGRYADGVWTGKELVVAGGQGDEKIFVDGAAYNPATRVWRRLPALPAPRMNATMTWTGTEVIMVGGLRSWGTPPYADAMAYRPATNTWRRLPLMEIRRFNHMAVWTGSQLLVWGGQSSARDPRTESFATPPHGVAYHPVTNSWSALPRAPLRGRTEAVAVWTGREMVIWGGQAAAPPYTEFRDGAAYRP